MKKKVLKIIFVAVILLFLVIQLYPVVWLFMASLKSSAELGSQPFALPKALVFSNYAEIFKDGKILRYMWNSVNHFDRGAFKYDRLCTCKISICG